MPLEVPSPCLSAPNTARSTTPTSLTVCAGRCLTPGVIGGVVADLELAGQGAEFADHEIPPPSESEWGCQLGAGLPDPASAEVTAHAVRGVSARCAVPRP
jgi:hypothetical protein